MKTVILRIKKEKPQPKLIKQAAETLKKGGVVAFPTETIYGLGANAQDAAAIKKIFKAKGRPNDNPLIIHIVDKKQVVELADNVSEAAKKLMDAFWPGPLTLILHKNKNSNICDEATAGLETIAIRMPKNKIAIELIKTANLPIAAPSANLSGKPSTTIGKHVIDDMNERIDLIIDAGMVDIGLESTVIDMTQKIPVILRPGALTKEKIELVIGKIAENKYESLTESANSAAIRPASPGMKYQHYSPNAQVFVIQDISEIKAIRSKNSSKKILQLSYSSKKSMAKNLFKHFRDADKKGYDIIIILATDEKDIGSAIMDRIKKATSKK